ncbi:Peptidase T [Anatilimnocola aggregata]|uniref:Peptidase T n=1 Tax=Anatilimnocola aggregata TaxID=2528021 RepID=A0A517Y4X8_9BACT|nr:peptidase T [Anatilimnocola aggregata]QDU25182.1 Peptidase T [Anatilimnocola aggregata]
MIQPERLLQRFLRYVQLDTTAGEPGGTYPSSPGQLVLGRMLSIELKEMGLADVEFTTEGLVYATVPSTLDAAGTVAAPVVAFNAHVDTSPETTGKNVRPQVIRKYAGGDIRLPADQTRVITLKENPELEHLKGKTLVTTDGTTLLGADDKSGIAVIMEMAQHLLEQPELEHGPVRILFTCDEEIGHGIDHVDLHKLNATVCYTLDGSGANEIDVETFSADLATVRVTGINIHPSIGKGRMVNALRAVGTFLDRLPRAGHSPETTAGREGFLHPYDLTGGVAEASLKVLLRDFDTAGLTTKAELLQKLASEVEQEHPGCKVNVHIKKQYRNLGDGLAKEPRAAAYADLAHTRLGREAKLTIIRGGTDGSQLTERGLPTPNLSTGEHNPHSPLEWTCLEEMVAATEVCSELVQVWAERK